MYNLKVMNQNPMCSTEDKNEWVGLWRIVETHAEISAAVQTAVYS